MSSWFWETTDDTAKVGISVKTEATGKTLQAAKKLPTPKKTTSTAETGAGKVLGQRSPKARKLRLVAFVLVALQSECVAVFLGFRSSVTRI